MILGAASRTRECLDGESARLREMDRSILAKAFRGELVPQDPTDEPASVLLERLRAERTAVAAGAPNGRARAQPRTGKPARKTRKP
jgi:type I restriction enzyme, S subunit